VLLPSFWTFNHAAIHRIAAEKVTPEMRKSLPWPHELRESIRHRKPALATPHMA
jgi:hypothetical protein